MPVTDQPDADRPEPDLPDVDQLAPARSARVVLGWLSLPVLAMVGVLVAQTLRSVGRRTLRVDPWHPLDPWLPTVIAGRAGYAVEPWPLLLTLGAVVTVGLVAASLGSLVLMTVRERPWWRRFLLLWAVVVVAGVVAAGASQTGELVHAIELFGDRGGSQLRTWTLPALAEAVRWGALWGFVPALVTALLAAPRPSVAAAVPDDDDAAATRAARRPRDVRRFRPVVALLLAAVVVGIGLAGAARGASISTMTEVADPYVAPTPDPTDTPAPVAATPAPPVEGRCDAGALVTTFDYTDAASGRRFGVATVTNVGIEACAVAGLPDLAFGAEDRTPVVPEIEPWGGFDGGGIPGDDILEPVSDAPVQLAPGRSARSELTWRGSGAGATTVATVHIAPWAGATRTILEEPIDLETGSMLGVSPWMVDDGAWDEG